MTIQLRAICSISTSNPWAAFPTSSPVPTVAVAGSIVPECFQVAIDDHSRIAFSQILPDGTAASAIAFLHASLAYYARLGIRVRRLPTDNGHYYRSHAFRRAVLALGLRHRFTRPYTPRTNGKAERFIPTALREWAYAFFIPLLNIAMTNSSPGYHYNWHRPHGSLNHAPPISRSGLNRNNLLRLHKLCQYKTLS